MICPNCNHENDDDSKFCINCGKKLENFETKKDDTTVLNQNKNNNFFKKNFIVILACFIALARIVHMALILNQTNEATENKVEVKQEKNKENSKTKQNQNPTITIVSNISPLEQIMGDAAEYCGKMDPKIFVANYGDGSGSGGFCIDDYIQENADPKVYNAYELYIDYCREKTSNNAAKGECLDAIISDKSGKSYIEIVEKFCTENKEDCSNDF